MRISDWSSDVCSSDLLIWGDELSRGELPDYDVFRTPTPHPLSTLFAAGASFLGGAADRFMVLVTMGSFLALEGMMFRLTQDRKSTVLGKSVSVSVNLGGRRNVKNNKHK